MCRNSEGADFVPYKKGDDFGSVKLAYKDRFFRHHGIAKSIIMDRDKRFISNFWDTFTSEIGMKSKLTKAYHPETDGQTEWANRTLKQYLRTYCNYRQDN